MVLATVFLVKESKKTGRGTSIIDSFDHLDLKNCSDTEAEVLCNRLRCALIDTVSRTGGHL
ncbi:MAG: 1-deoxy-D-xylulose-5-phosphate synthase N-terminal domain-containing protein, partial [Oscillospiraceae bacterium]